MASKFGIPEDVLTKIRSRDKYCAYCRKLMISPQDGDNRRTWATIEHLNFDGPFYWKEGLLAADIVICCQSCNSSRGMKKLYEWFGSNYCIKTGINERTVSEPVKDYLRRLR
jgi:hypothetical protein